MRERKSKAVRTNLDIVQYIMNIIFMLNIIWISINLSLRGAGYLGLSWMIVFGFTSVLSEWFTNFTARYVKGRISRKQYKNAHRFFQSAMLYIIILQGLFSALLMVFADLLGKYLFQDIHISFCIRVLAPAIVLYGIWNVMCGYFKGLGISQPVKIAIILQRIAMVVLSFIGYSACLLYGEKVAAILKSGEVSFVYGAAGAVLGWEIGLLISMITLWVFYFLVHRDLKRNREQDTTKYPEGHLELIRTIFLSGFRFVLKGICYGAAILIDWILYCQFCSSTKDMSEAGAMFGYGLPISILASMGLLLMFQFCFRGIPGYVKNEQYDMVRKKVSGIIFGYSLLVLPIALVIAVLGAPVFHLLTGETNAFGVTAMNFSGLLIALFCMLLLLQKVLEMLFETGYVILAGGIGFLLQTALCILMLKLTELGAVSILVSVSIECLLIAALLLSKLRKRLHFSMQLLRKTAMAFIVSFSAGLVILCIYQFIGTGLEDVLSILICIPVYLIVYVVLIIILHVVPDEMLEYIPGGALFHKLQSLNRRF